MQFAGNQLGIVRNDAVALPEQHAQEHIGAVLDVVEGGDLRSMVLDEPGHPQSGAGAIFAHAAAFRAMSATIGARTSPIWRAPVQNVMTTRGSFTGSAQVTCGSKRLSSIP